MEINKMTIEEVLRALADGKIVKVRNISGIIYVGMKNGTVLYNRDPHNLRETSFSFDPSYIYSIYEPPKPKKRYWQWKLQNSDGLWYRNDFYMDEDGYTTGGSGAISSFTTSVERIKIEDDYIEV